MTIRTGGVQQGRSGGATTGVEPALRRMPRWLTVVADPVKLHIVELLSEVDEATAADMAIAGAVSHQTLRRHLEALVTVGVIRETPGCSDGETPGRPAARFALSPAIREHVRAVLRSAAPAGIA